MMYQYRGKEGEYRAENYDVDDMDDDVQEDFSGRQMGDSDSEDEYYGVPNNRIPETSSAEARRGMDILGIPWDRLSITREQYRKSRLEQYKNYENVPQSREGSGKGCKVVKKRCNLL